MGKRDNLYYCSHSKFCERGGTRSSQSPVTYTNGNSCVYRVPKSAGAKGEGRHFLSTQQHLTGKVWLSISYLYSDLRSRCSCC